MTEHTRERPDDAPAAPGEAAPAAALSAVADALAALRVAAGETDALAAAAVEWFDKGDWGDEDPVLVDRVASLLGLLAKTTSALIAAVERLHGAIADAQPAAVAEEW